MDKLKGKRPLPVGPLSALPLLAAAFAIVAKAPAWFLAALGMFLLLGTPLYARRQRHTALHSLLAFKPRSISDVRPEQIGIEMSRVAKEKIPRRKSFPPYIHRKQEDDRIRRCLKKHRFVIVVGNRYAGKTRAALEAIRGDHQGKVLFVRRSLDGDNPLRELLSKPWLVPKRSRCVVFVDKLDSYLDDLDPHEIDSWLEGR